MPTGTHNPTVNIVVSLEALPAVPAGFGVVTLIADEALGTTLDGDRIRTYPSVEAAQTDQTAGFISAAILAAITSAFSQPRKPASVQIARVDTGGGESYSDALVAMEATAFPLYALCMETRASATQVLFATTIAAAARPYLLFVQTGDGGVITAGFPAAMVGTDIERAVGNYHTTATEFEEFAWAVNRLAFDPDLQSVPWECQVEGIAAMATLPTQAQLDFAKGNGFNVNGVFGPADHWLAPAKSIEQVGNGFTVAELLTRDWFAARAFEAVSNEKVRLSGRGEKIPVTIEGQGILLAVLQAVIDTGITAGHFVRDQFVFEAEPISAADLAALRLRFTGSAQFANSARQLDFTFTFGRLPVVVPA